MVGYKLLRQRKDGTLGSLFINRKAVIPVGEWMDAEERPTKGYAVRPGWHCLVVPYAPHLSLKGRVWAMVNVEDYEIIERPVWQGGTWLLAKRMKVIECKPKL